MKKYIDKDALVAEIKIRIETYNKGYANGDYCRADALETFLHDIDSLEVKEVKEAKEVNLENEFFNWYNEEKNRDYNASILYEKYSTISKKFAKHFFELGLNAQRKIGYVPNIDDSLKELGVEPSSKEAKIFKESYCAALDKFMAQKGE